MYGCVNMDVAIGDVFKVFGIWVGVKLFLGEFMSFLVDGVIFGVFVVIVFFFVIMIFMGCISFLEDMGYMVWVVFIMDLIVTGKQIGRAHV